MNDRGLCEAEAYMLSDRQTGSLVVCDKPGHRAYCCCTVLFDWRRVSSAA